MSWCCSWHAPQRHVIYVTRHSACLVRVSKKNDIEKKDSVNNALSECCEILCV